MKKNYSLSLILFIIGINLGFSQTVVTMPSWTNNHNEGNAIVNQPITVWGAVIGQPISNYQVMLCVDNAVVTTTPVATNGSYANGHYIEYSYTPTTTGCKIVSLKVIIGANDTLESQSYIKVFSPNDPGIDTIIVNMAIDKGLLFLFKNATLVSANNVQWSSSAPNNGWDVTSSIETYTATCSAILAFEEEHHLYGNGLKLDPYADLVQSGLNNIFGSATSNCVLNNSSWTSCFLGTDRTNCTYTNGIGLTAIIMAQPNLNAAKSQFNNVVNKTYYNFDSLAIQYIYNNQGSDGCWHYDLDGGYDGSCQQWPTIFFLAAKQRYNMPLVASPNSHIIQAISCYLTNVCGNGGTPYGAACSSWNNIGITGGMLSAFGLVNRNYLTDNYALNSMTYVVNNFNLEGYNGGWSSTTGWPGSLYHMYGLKRGLYIQQNNTLKPFTLNGTTIDWYGNLASWLTGEKAFALNPTLKANNSSMLSAKYSYGQDADGSWQDNCLFNDGSWYFSTAFAILILSRNMFQQVNVVNPAQLSMCSGDSIQLIAPPGNYFNWTPTTNLDYPNIQKPWASPDSTTTYYVNCVDQFHCPTDTAFTVNVIDTFSMSFMPDTFSICPPGIIHLTPNFGTSGAVNCIWSPPLYLSSTTGQSVICKPTSDSLSSITYNVVGTAGNSCTGEASVTVNINPSPVITASVTPKSVCKGDSARITFDAESGNAPFIYKWSNNDSIVTDNTVSTITVAPTITTTYTVTFTDSTTCGDIKTIAVTVKPAPKPVIIGDTTTCTGAQRVLYTTDNGMSNYIWSVSGGHITTNDGSMILVFWTAAGQDTAKVTYTGADGCTGTTSYPVTVNPTPATPTITLEGTEIVSSFGTGNQWYNSNGPMTGDTSSTYTPPWGGVYYDIVTKDGCASLPSNSITIVGIEVLSNPNNFIKIYPNPAKDVINIELLSDNNNFKNLLISLYDIEGKELLNTNFNNLQTKQISTKEFSKGVYYLKIYNDNFVVFNKILII